MILFEYASRNTFFLQFKLGLCIANSKFRRLNFLSFHFKGALLRKNNLIETILGPLSKTLTLFMILLTSFFAQATPEYAMTVVKSARVMGPNEKVKPAMVCGTVPYMAPAVASIGWNQTTTKPQKIFSISSSQSVYATRNSDEAFVKTVTLWLEIKNRNTLKYFSLTDVDMQNFEWPKIKFEGNRLVIEADTLSVAPEDENEIMPIPTIPGQLQRTLSFGPINANGLSMMISSCY
jgi:hypothetical protein